MKKFILIFGGVVAFIMATFVVASTIVVSKLQSDLNAKRTGPARAKRWTQNGQEEAPKPVEEEEKEQPEQKPLPDETQN